MIRNHTLFVFIVTHDAPIMIPDPDAPGGGEMVRSGAFETQQRNVRVIAENYAIAYAWLMRPFSGYTKLRVESCIESKIDAFIETHTW